MKKSFIKLIFLFSLILFSFSGCNYKHLPEEESDFQRSINDFIYNYTKDFLYNNENTKNYLPDSLKTLFNRIILKDGGFYTFFEYLYPEAIAYSYLDFYDFHSDNGEWVEDIIFEFEEERIAQQLAEMENILNSANENSDVEGQAKKAEETISLKVPNEVTDINNNLTYLEYDEEIFIPQFFEDKTILIHAFKENITRSFYDSLFRCYREESWKITPHNKEELVSSTESKYFENNYTLVERNTLSKDFEINQFYNKEGLLETENQYYLVDDTKSIKSSLNLIYNKENKVKESSLTEYTYKDEKYKKLLYSFNKKYVYSYNKDDIPPDFDYYENNVLKVSNKYTSGDMHTSRIYFDDGYSVTTFYQDNKPIKEVFSTKDRVERINNYEQ